VFAQDEARLLCGHTADPARLEALVDRRLAGAPLEQVLGWAEFGGLRIAVEPGVFVPRRRTELLAEQAVAVARAVTSRGRRPVVVELCCGSGAVSAVVLGALGDPGDSGILGDSGAPGGVDLHACDLDPVAVRCARANLGERARVVAGDLYDALPATLAGRVDVLVANAPYVPEAELELMPPEARLHEPVVALSGGPDGLQVLRRVISGAPAWLAPGATLLVESGADQAAPVAALMAGAGLRARAVHAPGRGATVVTGTSREPSRQP